MERDFRDEMIARRTRANPEFPARLEAARAERAELKAKLEAGDAALPEPTGEERVDEILSRRSKARSAD